MIRCFVIAVSWLWVIFPLISKAQFYSTGENPASVRWKQLETTHFRIIYPADLTDGAGLLAVKLESNFKADMGELAFPLKKKFPVLAESASVLSNGYVTLAPRRMELVLTPPQDSYSQDWITQLALHELRHVAQLNRLNQGFTHIAGWFTGEIARGTISSLVPSWFYEGDAVHTETELSESGRGRSAAFEMPLRTLLLEKKPIYSYDKALFGSLRDFVPDRYVYGYQMTGLLRKRYGNEAWANGLDYTARNPYMIYPFAFYLKSRFGFYKRGLYHLTVDSLKKQYDKNKEPLIYTKYTRINTTVKKVYTEYLYPHETQNRTIISWKEGMDEPGSFVETDSMGVEKRIGLTGRRLPGNSDLSDNRVVWDEIVQDPRWEKRNYSIIRELNLTTGRQRKITRKSRYFSPAFSPDATRIAVAETDILNRNYITILRSDNGKALQKILLESKAAIKPEWISDHAVLFVSVSDRGKQIETVDLLTGNQQVLIPYTNNELYDPVSYRNWVFFRATKDNIENIFAIYIHMPGKIFQVTHTLYGARHPSVSRDEKYLYFSEYSADGFNITRTLIDTTQWIPVEFAGASPVNKSGHDTTWTINEKPYNKAMHLFNFHSGLPFYTDVEEVRNNPFGAELYPGFMLFSQNLLGTAISTIGYSYERGYHYLHPSFTWRGWYPVMQLEGHIGGPQQVLLPPEYPEPDFSFPYYSFTLKTYIPLTFNRGAYTTFLRPGIDYEYAKVLYNTNDELITGLDLVHFRLNVSNYKRRSVRDIYPRLGQYLTITYTSGLPAKQIYGTLASAEMALFFPGLSRHHHLFVVGGFQSQDQGRFLLPYARIDFPRGYEERISREFSSLLLNYAFPVAYPDWTLGPFLYLKRIRMNLFYDVAYGKEIREFDPALTLNTGWLSSYGTEITADLHALRIIFPVQAGIRIGYTSQARLFADFLVSMNMNL